MNDVCDTPVRYAKDAIVVLYFANGQNIARYDGRIGIALILVTLVLFVPLENKGAACAKVPVLESTSSIVIRLNSE